jgi:MATE family multidrug resistance protein
MSMLAKVRRIAPSLRRIGASQANVLRLAWPIACTLLGETLMALVDTKLVGGLGGHALGGVAIANTALYLTFVSVLGLLRGVKICTAHAVGAGRPEAGFRYAQVGMAIGAVVGLIVAVILPYLLPALSPQYIGAELLPTAQPYLVARSFGVPATFMVAALNEYRQGQGDVRLPMLVGLGGNVVNAILAYSLIYGHMGLPALGAAGAGWGTCATEMLQLLGLGLAVAIYRRRERRGLPAPRVGVGSCARELLRIGIPTGLHAFCEYCTFVVCTAMLVHVGEIEVAASQVVSAINRVAYMPGLAVAEVTCILVGQALGAQRVDEADKAVRAGLGVAVTVMVACGAMFIACRHGLAHFFSAEAEIADRVQQVLWVAGIFQVLDACNLVMRGALRGARDVRAAAVIGTVVLWACVPTVTYAVGYRGGHGALGAWLSFLVATGLCAAVYSYRWAWGPWRQRFTKAGLESAAAFAAAGRQPT